MKQIIVTGACGGLGKTVVERLLTEGYGVWAVDNSYDKLEQCFFDKDNINMYACDLTSENELITMIRRVLEKTGPIGGLVHFAGISRFVPIHMIKQEQMEDMFKIHVFAAIKLCSLLSKKGNAENGCSIVLLSSMAAHEGSSGNSVYAAAKSALEGFVRSSAHDFVDRGIRINVIIPGDIDAGMFHSFVSKLKPEQVEERKKKYPLGFGSSDNIADVVEFLLSEKASWMTGQCYVIDGGHSIQRV